MPLKKWCKTHKIWSTNQWKTVIWSDDEFCFILFPISGMVYVWRIPLQVFGKECLLSRVKHGADSVMIWPAISWYSVGSNFITLERNVWKCIPTTTSIIRTSWNSDQRMIQNSTAGHTRPLFIHSKKASSSFECNFTCISIFILSRY